MKRSCAGQFMGLSCRNMLLGSQRLFQEMEIQLSTVTPVLVRRKLRIDASEAVHAKRRMTPGVSGSGGGTVG